PPHTPALRYTTLFRSVRRWSGSAGSCSLRQPPPPEPRAVAARSDLSLHGVAWGVSFKSSGSTLSCCSQLSSPHTRAMLSMPEGRPAARRSTLCSSALRAAHSSRDRPTLLLRLTAERSRVSACP